MLPFKRKTPQQKTSPKPPSLFARLKSGLQKTRSQLGDNLTNLLLGKPEIDAQLIDSLTDTLLQADIGIETSEYIIDSAKNSLSRQQTQDSQALLQAIKQVMLEILEPCSQQLNLPLPYANCILFVGVNGAGKTTSIAKLAHYYQSQKKQVMLAAGDTFRAAAIEQLQTWGQRYNIPVIAQSTGADSAAVIFDALQACQARQFDLLIADTAGRLHTQDNLIKELAKIKRVMGKLDETAPQVTMLVLDATSGQNALTQAQQFNQAIAVDGIILSKLDSSAKGGIVFAIAHQLKLPIYFIGVGEGIEDLQPFAPKSFIDALFNAETTP